jgi:hypothetical protein
MGDLSRKGDLDVNIVDKTTQISVEVTAEKRLKTETTLVNEYVADGKGFISCVELSVSVSTEFDFFLLKNPSGSGKQIRLDTVFLSAAELSTTVPNIVRWYFNPTITANGTANAIMNRLSSNGASIMNAYSAPTISNRGTHWLTVPYSLSFGRFELRDSFIIDDGDSMLVTVELNKINRIQYFCLAWGEI